MERRVLDRVKRRVTCELVCDEQRASGIVLDMSPSGLFVQTGAKLARESEVLLRMSTSDGVALEIETLVARRRNIPPHLASVSSSGIGLRIRYAPNAYYEQLGVEPPVGNARPTSVEEAPPSQPDPSEPERELQRFRVRVRHQESCRSRTVSVEAPDDEAARTQALEKVGDDWEILATEAA